MRMRWFYANVVASSHLLHSLPFPTNSHRVRGECMWIFVGNVRFVLHSFIKSPMRHFFFIDKMRACLHMYLAVWEWRYLFTSMLFHCCCCCYYYCFCCCCRHHRIVFWWSLKMTNSTIERFVWTLYKCVYYILKKEKTKIVTKYNYALLIERIPFHMSMHVCMSFCESSHNI